MKNFKSASVATALAMISSSGIAAPIGSVGPSEGEAVLLYGLPLLGCGILTLLMLLRWRTFAALLGATLVASLWVAFVLSTAFGVSSMRFNPNLMALAVLSLGWVVFAIFLTAYWLSCRPTDNDKDQRASEIGTEAS